MNDTLVVDGLSKFFNNNSSTPVLDDINLTLEAGSCTAVLGPSGSGKSTLLRAIAGLEHPDAGRIVLRGTDLAAISPERRGMAMVSQRPLLFPHMNVLDNVAFPATVRGVRKTAARADAEEFLEMVQLEGFGQRKVVSLSGGQQQRIAIARALAARPAILLMDEPFSALDQELRATMHELLAELRHRLAPTILMVTHDRDEAAVVADRIALLSRGRLLQHESIDRLYSRPASLEVHRLMGGTNELMGTVHDGVHYSALGDLDLPDDTEWRNGPGVLVVRQESIGIQATVAGAKTAGVPATVSGIRRLGPRQLVTVEASGAKLQAEAPWGMALHLGHEVLLTIPVSACAIVPGPISPGGAVCSDPSPAVMAADGA